MPPKRKRQVEESHHPHSLRLDERRNSKLCELQPTEKILVTTTNSRSTVQIGVHSLSSTTITANPRTFRLSLIPKSVAECSFLEYLGGLECNTGVPTGNILGFSFAPYITWYVATVTFREEPVAFKECHHNKKVYVHLPYKLDERRTVITVDCDFHGLTPLFNPSSSSTQVKFDVVAVSGLSSHAFGSWRSREQYHMMWLRDILPLDFPNFRVFIWGYDSDLNKSTATSSISDFSKRLLLSVYGARCEGEENDIHRPIIFVGHSLGGLVIKQALVEAAQSSSKNVHTILESCIGVFLFGVPNKGLNNENLLSLAKGKNTADFVGSLKEGSELLRSLHAAFRCCYQDYLKACFVVSFYETEDTKSVIEASDGKWKREGKPIRMVTLESATSFMPTEDEHNKIPIASDHSNLVKFTGRDDQNYLAVRSKMKEMIQGFKDYETKPENPAASGPNVKQLSRTDSLDPPQPGPNGSQNKNETKEPVIPEIPLEIGKPVTSIPGELVLTIKAFHAASKRIQGYKTPDEPSDPFFHEFETEKSGFYQHIRYLFDDIVNNMIILRLLANPDSGEWRNVAASTACVPTHPNCSMYLKVVASMTKSIDVFLDHPLDSVEPLNTDKHRESIIQWCHNVFRSKVGSSRKFSMQRARNHYPQVASPKNKIRKEVFQALIDDIRHYNKRLSEFVVLKRKQASNLLTLSKTPSTLVAASTHTLGSRNPRIISTMLYEALSKCATCNCHELYLRLETSEEPDNQQSPNRDILSDSNNPHPLIRFSLLIADKNTSASSGPPNKYLLLGIVSASSSSTLISENMSQRKPILCARELKNIINENKYFLEGFLVYESSHNGATTRDIGIRKSLKQLLKEIPGNDILRKLDLGGSLGNAAIQFHSSPWIKFWDTETVTMFASHNKNLPSVGESLIPHILSVPKLVEHSATCNIGDLYQLGLMLLEVAGEDSTKFHIRLKVSGLDYISQPNWTLVDSLVRKVGRPYKNFVRRCFEIGWSLPDSGCACEDDLDKLFKDLKEIDKLASNFRRCL